MSKKVFDQIAEGLNEALENPEDHRLIKSAKSARDGNVTVAIPEDVIKAATDFQDMVDGDPKAYTAFDIAVLAILAERGACAKIAHTYADCHSESHKVAGHAIARRILYDR